MRFILENGEKELTNPQLPTAGPDPIALRRALSAHPKKSRPVAGHGRKRDPRGDEVLDAHARLKNQALLDGSELKI